MRNYIGILKSLCLVVILILTGSSQINAQVNSDNNTIQRKVLFEEFTGNWCGWCPRGHIILENILHENANITHEDHRGRPADH